MMAEPIRDSWSGLVGDTVHNAIYNDRAAQQATWVKNLMQQPPPLQRMVDFPEVNIQEGRTAYSPQSNSINIDTKYRNSNPLIARGTPELQSSPVMHELGHYLSTTKGDNQYSIESDMQEIPVPMDNPIERLQAQATNQRPGAESYNGGTMNGYGLQRLYDNRHNLQPYLAELRKYREDNKDKINGLGEMFNPTVGPRLPLSYGIEEGDYTPPIDPVQYGREQQPDGLDTLRYRAEAERYSMLQKLLPLTAYEKATSPDTESINAIFPRTNR